MNSVAIMSGKRSASEALAEEPDTKAAKTEPAADAWASAGEEAASKAHPHAGAAAAAGGDETKQEEDKEEDSGEGATAGDRMETEDLGEGDDADAMVSSLPRRTRGMHGGSRRVPHPSSFSHSTVFVKGFFLIIFGCFSLVFLLPHENGAPTRAAT